MSNSRDYNFNPETDRDRDYLRQDLSKQYQVLQTRINECYDSLARIEKIIGPRFEVEAALKPGELGFMSMYKLMSCYRMQVNAVKMMEDTQLEIMEKLVGPDFQVEIDDRKDKDTDEERRKRRIAERCLNDLAQKYNPSMVPPSPPG